MNFETAFEGNNLTSQVKWLSFWNLEREKEAFEEKIKNITIPDSLDLSIQDKHKLGADSTMANQCYYVLTVPEKNWTFLAFKKPMDGIIYLYKK